MKEILKTLEDLGFYSYEDPTLVLIIQMLQLKNNSVWITDGRYKRLDALDTTLSSAADELMDNGNEFLYLYRPLPPHRCFSLDKEDVYEYPPIIFEDDYLCNSLRRCGIMIKDVDEYEDLDGSLHLITDAGDFLICPTEFRSSSTQNIYLNWRVVTARILLMLNTLLSQADSDERFYVLGEEGKEGITTIVLLSSSMSKFFQETKELEERDLPKPIEKYFENILP
nr:hypothetical protein [Nostoc sp. ChiSLP03a]MDZ8213883.1 hypothetical protein [Nostoc sp. ChiSLP03a]